MVIMSLGNNISEWINIVVSNTVQDWVKHGVPLPFNVLPQNCVLPKKTMLCKEMSFVTSEINCLVENGI